MYAVAIRELKARLSEYVRRAKAGEVVLITDRGRVVAELRAPTVRETPEDELGPLHRLVEAGALKPGLPHDPSLYHPTGIVSPPQTAADLLDWLRNDRVSPEEAVPDGEVVTDAVRGK